MSLLCVWFILLCCVKLLYEIQYNFLPFENTKGNDNRESVERGKSEDSGTRSSWQHISHAIGSRKSKSLLLGLNRGKKSSLLERTWNRNKKKNCPNKSFKFFFFFFISFLRVSFFFSAEENGGSTQVDYSLVDLVCSFHCIYTGYKLEVKKFASI